ncbi:MAG: hypothetical protein Q7T55_16995 [Solirubrobacteraceae bacterium]|nr:hypothetical protein [Solirubrobacteraceae bacterium]
MSNGTLPMTRGMVPVALAVPARFVRLVAAATLVLFGGSPAAGAAPQRIAERPAELGPAGAAIDGLDAEGGVVAWQETRLPASTTGEPTYRVAVRARGTTRRSDWRRNRQFVDVGPAIDPAGRVRTRAQTWSCDAQSRCAATVIRSPSSLRPVAEEWVERRASPAARRQPAVLGRTVADDGSGVIDVDEPGGAASRPSSCAFRLLGRMSATALPPIDDCRLRWSVGLGRMVVASYSRPSEPVAEADGKNSGEPTRFFAAADRTAASPSWVELGTYGEGRGVTDGVQAVCLLADRVVVLRGSTDAFEDDAARSTFGLTAVRPGGGKSWSTPTPELGLDASNDVPPVQIACTGRWVYAAFTRSWPDGRRSPVARIVRYRIPG